MEKPSGEVLPAVEGHTLGIYRKKCWRRHHYSTIKSLDDVMSIPCSIKKISWADIFSKRS